ncbi:uncharacterized protein LOC126848965 [Cataglyphis hispanica]|uniref:uncharacterized protein LOC126848965 n=1 Tax=Cataglyphis hispanica TaxID=1086592 RepID=UPI00217FC6D5|nr:uncharacterized protein LOC126848965 [Cataglyphis hispanica]
MVARRALPFLLLVICAISAASIIKNGRDDPNNIRRIRRINLSEYLVPPPLPKFHPPGRIARLVTPQPTEASGYFMRFMSWFNPFGSSSKTSLSPPPPPPPPQIPHTETAYSPSPKFIPPSAPTEIYGGPSPAIYDRPPPPSSSLNNHPGYPSSDKGKNCNPCNKVPWMPIQHDEYSHSGDASFALPPPPPPSQLSPSLNGEYLPPRNREIPYDAHHAASQEVRAPDFSLPPLLSGQDGSLSPLSNPHLYPGAMPPLFKPQNFSYLRGVPNSDLDYLDTPPSPVFRDVISTGKNSFSSTAELNFNGEALVHPDFSNSDSGFRHQELGYTNSDVSNPGVSNGWFEHFNTENYSAHGDLSPSGTQVSHGHSDLIPDQQRFENIATQSSLDSINHQTSFGNSGVLIDQNPPSSYGISSLDRIPDNLEHQYNDLSSSANVVEDSRAPLRATDGSSGKIEDSIHFEESLLLDFTNKDESRTDLSSIADRPLTSNAFADSTETAGRTLTFGDEIYETRHDINTTESHLSKDHLQTINFVTPSEESKINDSATQDSNGDLRDHKTFRGQDISYIPPSDQVGYLWSSVISTTSRNTERGGLLNTLNSVLNSYDDVAKETLNQNFGVKSKDTNKTSTEQNEKKSKQIRIIIPYTSQYTSLPFQSSHEQNHDQKALIFANESNHDKYFSEESRNRIKVTSLPNSSYTRPTTSALLADITRKSIGTKVNNSIDVHKLQKNIDNWTIQEYSKGTTAASTVSPSSVNPYLFPSKQIPDEYLTTTESVNHINSYDDNVKTFTLAGFSFNDLDYKGSASNHVEGSRIQVIKNSKSTENSIDTSTASTTNDNIWQGFSVDISPVNNERVYVVTPQSIITTPKSNSADKKKEKAAKATDKNAKVLETETKKKKSNTFESIEKAYLVLPQAVNNLAVASTGPESVPLWGIMEHEDFASLDENEHENEDNESPEIPVLYAGHSKVSRASR